MSILKINKYSYLVASFSLALLLLPSCGGSVKDPAPGSGTGKVALFITDNISMYKQVVGTVTGVRLLHSGVEGNTCDVLSAPVTLDIANLTDIAQYVDLATCKADRYNRIEIDIKKDVHLMDQLNNTSACSLTRIRNTDGSVDSLSCDTKTGICTVGIRGGVRDSWVVVQEDMYNDLGIDFNLKQFTVREFGEHDCSVTMAAATISASDFNESGRAHSVTAAIANLDTAARTFTLLASGAALTVEYSAINPSLQPNVGTLLQKAQSEGLKVNVRTGKVDIERASLSAERIYLKVAGAVSGITGAPQWHFNVISAPSLTIPGDYRPSHFNPAQDLQGTFTNGVWADVKFGGFSSGRYEAAAIEVLPNGTVLDD